MGISTAIYEHIFRTTRKILLFGGKIKDTTPILLKVEYAVVTDLCTAMSCPNKCIGGSNEGLLLQKVQYIRNYWIGGPIHLMTVIGPYWLIIAEFGVDPPLMVS